MSTHVRSWTPISGEQQARLITHHEAIEIAHYLTLYDTSSDTPWALGKEKGGSTPLYSEEADATVNPTAGAAGAIGDEAASSNAVAVHGGGVGGRTVMYRPTVHYAYRPCDDAEVSLAEVEATGYCLPEKQSIMKQHEIAPGE